MLLFRFVWLKWLVQLGLTDEEKDPFESLNVDDIISNNHQRIDLIEIFGKTRSPIQSHQLETNSSTLSFSNAFPLIHDQKK